MKRSLSANCRQTPFLHQDPLLLRKSERGVALVLVLFVVALASIIVVNLSYSASLEMRTNLMVERGLKSEYLLKSAINFGRAILREDTSPEDAPQDTWGLFRNGIPIPTDALNIHDPALKSLELEIRPEESKLPVAALLSGGSVNIQWRDVFHRFFVSLGFDEDEEEDESGYFPGRVFKSDELVANLIDYMDQDSDSYQSNDFVSGIESELPEGVFPNRSLQRIGNLTSIPGFTASRVRQLTPFLTAFGNRRRLNINLAPSAILRALHEEIGDEEVSAIVAFRENGEEGPFTNQNRKEKLSEILGEAVYDELAPMLDVQSRWFQILAKVDYGTSTNFARAYVSQAANGEMPVTRIMELF